MSNPYKVNAATQSGCISKGNFQIGVENIDYGPSILTDFYVGITVPSGGYAWYKSSGAGAHIRVAESDQVLVNIVNEEFQQGFTQATSALIYINNNSNQYITNITYPAIPTRGLTLLTDMGFVASYPKTGFTASSVDTYSKLGAFQKFDNGPIYGTAFGGCMTFDGVDDVSYFSDNSGNFGIPLTGAFTAVVIMRSTQATWNQFGVMLNNRYNDGSGFIIGSDAGTNNVTYYMGDSNAFRNIGTFTGISIQSPHMYAISSNGSNLHKRYLDNLTPVGTTASYTRANAVHEIFIGRDSYFSRYGAIEYYVCLYYNRQLSDQEVLDIYNAYSSRFGW